MERTSEQYIRWFTDLGSDDVPIVGGKNASLGEMAGALGDRGVNLADGFATTAEAYRATIEANDLAGPIQSRLEALEQGESSLAEAGKAIRRLLREAEFPGELADAIRQAYSRLCEQEGIEDLDVAVRSSATAEDLPEASFAGQQETFLNVTGEQELLEACRKCFASLFTDRAIAYRREQGFDHMEVALSVGVQRMVRSDKAGAGVLFTLDTETGFPEVVVINAAWGLGETVVQGTVTPDEYVVFKPLLGEESLRPVLEKTLGEKEKKMVYAAGGDDTTKTVDTSRQERDSFVLSDDEVLTLARWGAQIEDHYEMPMDIEWAKDGISGELFIVQARPETVQSQRRGAVIKTYRLAERGERLVQGLAIGSAIATGRVQIIEHADQIDEFEEGSVLVTGMTDPDWVPAMKRAAGIVTDHGGRTSHAAIVSREFGIPAVVGTGGATDVLEDGMEVTLSCAEGDEGFIYEGVLEYEESEIDLEGLPATRTRIMLNLASPATAFGWWQLPCKGVGLARMEFIINNIIQVHPLALSRFDEVEDREARRKIEQLTRNYDDKTEYFVERLARGIARIAASQYPEPAIVRMSDFKTNEYADLIGGAQFEPDEENPMLGFRGASRYYSDAYRDGFALECRAIKRARDEIGLSNIVVMVPFCRSVAEADRVLEVMAENGLVRGEGDLQVYCMAEVPSNVILAEQFAERFDGFSIGSNDLIQLVLGVDRDSEMLSDLFDERDEALARMIRDLIATAHECGLPVGICGQAPSDYPDFAAFLVEAGIDSMSLTPDSVVGVIRRVAEAEAEAGGN